jgi:hypothetical protein
MKKLAVLMSLILMLAMAGCAATEVVTTKENIVQFKGKWEGQWSSVQIPGRSYYCGINIENDSVPLIGEISIQSGSGTRVSKFDNGVINKKGELFLTGISGNDNQKWIKLRLASEGKMLRGQSRWGDTRLIDCDILLYRK